MPEINTHRLEIIREKINFYDKIFLFQFFVTNKSFFDKSLSKTYFKISNSIIYLVDYSNTTTIDNFLDFYVGLETKHQEKVTLIVIRPRISSNSLSRNSSHELTGSKSKCFSKKSSVASMMDPNCPISVHKLKTFIKIYKIVSLYIRDFSEVTMRNSLFTNFIGYHILKKSDSKRKGKFLHKQEDDNSSKIPKHPDQTCSFTSNIVKSTVGPKQKRQANYRCGSIV